MTDWLTEWMDLFINFFLFHSLLAWVHELPPLMCTLEWQPYQDFLHAIMSVTLCCPLSCGTLYLVNSFCLSLLVRISTGVYTDNIQGKPPTPTFPNTLLNQLLSCFYIFYFSPVLSAHTGMCVQGCKGCKQGCKHSKDRILQYSQLRCKWISSPDGTSGKGGVAVSQTALCVTKNGH